MRLTWPSALPAAQTASTPPAAAAEVAVLGSPAAAADPPADGAAADAAEVAAADGAAADGAVDAPDDEHAASTNVPATRRPDRRVTVRCVDNELPSEDGGRFDRRPGDLLFPWDATSGLRHGRGLET